MLSTLVLQTADSKIVVVSFVVVVVVAVVEIVIIVVFVVLCIRLNGFRLNS